MYVRSIALAAFFAIALSAGSYVAFAAEDAKAKKKEDGPASAVAKIGDSEVVTKEEFDRTVAALEQMAMMRQRSQGVAVPHGTQLNHEQKLRTLDSLVNSRIVLMMAKEAGIKVADVAVKAEIEKNKTALPSGTDYAAFLRQRGLTEQDVFERKKQHLEMKAFEEQKTKDVAVSDEEVKQQFDKLKERGETEDFDVQHIFIKAGDPAAIAEAKKRIDAAYERVKKGEDFAAVATEVTEDDRSKESGGEYKGMHRGMVPEFDKRMAAMKAGEVSEPFTSQYGWHILKVNRHGTGELTAEIGERIKTKILAMKRQMAMSKLIQEKRSTLDITINLPAEAPSTASTPPGEAAPKAVDSLIDAAS